MGVAERQFFAKVVEQMLLSVKNCVYTHLLRYGASVNFIEMVHFVQKSTLFGQLSDGLGGLWRRRRSLVLQQMLLSGKN